MFTVLDRYLLRSLLANYLVALGVMLSLYVVLDMFVNMDEFTEKHDTVLTVLANMADYYLPNLFLYFSQLSGVITVFACGAVLARMRKLNELTAILASGVSLYRVARPVLIFGVVMTGLLVLDTEWLIPSVAHKLSRDHDDADGKRAYEVLFLKDRGGALVSAGRFHPTTRALQRLLVLVRDESGAIVQTWDADQAVWQPPTAQRPTGRWKLERGRLVVRSSSPTGFGPRDEQRISYPEFYESELSPEAVQLRQARGWMRYLSLRRLRELEADQTADLLAIKQTRHTRIAAPIVSLLLLLLSVPFFLDRSPANVLGDAGRCVLVCGLCYVVTFIAQNIHSTNASAVPTWIPIFIFGTLAMVLLDRVRT